MLSTKKFFSIIILSLFAINLFAESNLSELKLKTSATCNNCKTKIEKAFKSTKGVKEVDLNLEDKYVTIKYNPEQTNETELKNVLIKTGYFVDESSNSKETKKGNCKEPCKHEKNDPNCCKSKKK